MFDDLKVVKVMGRELEKFGSIGEDQEEIAMNVEWFF